MLSDRRQRVLSALIEEYVAFALPVGSRTLVERYQLGVSPATVRNELSILEDAGYIVQPHTSAGRVPTDSGYRSFVDTLLESDTIQEKNHEAEVLNELRETATELDDLLDRTSAALSRLTDCLSIVWAPSLALTQIKHISLVSLGDYQVIMVLVTEDGQVLNRHIEFADKIDTQELAKTQNALNKLFVGKNFLEVGREINSDLLPNLQEPLMRMVLDEVLACLKESKQGKTHQLGVSSLLKKPEFCHSHSLLPILQILEDNAVLFHIFDGETNEKETVVRIGRENATKSLSGVSVVAGHYGREEAAGVVAVIGPTRMDYSRVLKAVHAAQEVLKDI